MERISNRLNVGLDIKYIILGLVSILVLLVMVYLGYKALISNDSSNTSQSKVVVKAIGKTYRKEITLAQKKSEEEDNFSNELDNMKSSEELSESIPTPTEILVAEASPTSDIKDKQLIGGLEEEFTPTPSDLPVATPSFKPPTPTEVLLASGGTKVLTPTNPSDKLPEAGYPNYYIFLIGISLFIIFVAFII